jgi:type IV secretory pathway VirB10-like protein
MTDETVEPSAKKTGLKAGVLVLIGVLCVIVLAASFRQPPTIAQAQSSDTTTDRGRTAKDFNADVLSRLQAETQASPANGAQANARLAAALSGASGTQGADSTEDLLRRLDDHLQAPANGNPRPFVPTTEAAPTAAASRDEKARDSLDAPLTGALAARTDLAVATAAPRHGKAPTTAGQLLPGTVIDITTSQATTTDYPGAPWIGVVTRPVLSRSGAVLVPQGAKLLGAVGANAGPNAVIANRTELTAQKLILPNGTVVALSATGLDAEGAAAITGTTDRHLLAQAGGVLAYALIGSAAYSTASTDPISARDQLTQQTAAQATQQAAPLAAKYLAVQPTNHVRPGTPIKIILTEATDLTTADRS